MREQDRGDTKMLLFLNFTTIMKHIRDAFWLFFQLPIFSLKYFGNRLFKLYTAAQILILLILFAI